MGLTGGDQRIGNVRKLMDLGSRYQEQGSASLSDFNRYMTVLKEKQLKIQSARVVGEDSELVRLMSVHKSKGLEFPVVIYAGLGKRFNRQEFNDALLFHNEWGLVSRYYDLDFKGKKATFHRDVLVNRLKGETAEEELRILYVALTRARERLVILGGVRTNQLDKKMRFWQSGIHLKGIRDQDTPLDWLMYNLYLDKNSQPPQKRVRVIERDRQEYEGLLGQKSHDSLEAFEGYLRDEVMREDEDLALPEEFAVRPEAIQAKMAVTALAHETLEPGEGVAMSYPDDFLRLKNARSPQEIGIEIHRLVEFIDDKRVRTSEDFMAQVKTLQKRKILSEDLESAYDLDQVYGFFTGPLGRRLARADRVYRERPFVLRDESLQGALIQGVIDLFFVEEGEAVLVDFKSDFVTETDYGRYLEAYQKQLSYYQRAIETLTGLRVKESYIHFFKINRSLLIFPSS
jgi:ATP-dependent helicase/nuclease subunit A